MSRVDDDRDAERVQQRLMQQKIAEEAKKKDRNLQDSQFARLVGQQKEQAQATEKNQSARSAIEHLLETSADEAQAEASTEQQHSAGREAEARGFKSRLGGKALGEKLATNARADAQRGNEAKLKGDQGRADSATSRSADGASSSKSAAGRAADAKTGRDVQADRAQAADASSSSHNDYGGNEGDKELKADADQGGKGGQQQGGSNEKKGDAPPSFRFNPALMAPPPVAQKNLAAGSDRLRRIATEIAQKIVEKVRVGTNALGNAEFQIDLRSNVLSGLSVKVSAKNGRISAVFSGNDREVLKMLEQQEEALKGALSSRGLTLERFKVEARA
ncbi:MAG: flagellar hook-length control protein FliK [Archangiaceae bacterium]|nr:flagellar hook-length control protein FliK [Archangiaceae bacterium]